MGFMDLFKSENRGVFDREGVRQSASNFFEQMGWVVGSETPVTTESALGVPAIWAAVQFLSGTMAGLPLHVFKKTKEGSERVTSGVAPIIGKAVSDGQTSFDWRKYGFEQVFTGGRFVSYIERNSAKRVVNIFPINPATLTIKSDGLRKIYVVKVSSDREVTYQANEVIDIPFMLKADMISHRSPITTNRRAVAMAIEASKYASKAFANGGVPPLVATGPFTTGAGAQRASDDIAKAMEEANKDGRHVLTMPLGHELKVLGFNAKDMQMIESQRFSIEEVARMYSLPPVFLQDLTHGTFSNTEQQDLHLVKHTINRWVTQMEQEMTLKLFGRNSNMYVRFNVDGLLRGDFATRMEGLSKAVQNALVTPNEGRALDERAPLDGGDSLMIQGATVPIQNQIAKPDGDPDDET